MYPQLYTRSHYWTLVLSKVCRQRESGPKVDNKMVAVAPYLLFCRDSD